MSSPSREHLLGYVLQALSAEEHEQVEAELDQNPRLRAELNRLESCVGQFGMTEKPDAFDPPSGLAARTCEFIAAQAVEPVVTPAGALAYQPIESHWRFTWSDFVTIAAVVVAAASLFFPMLSLSRFQSQVYACQYQLQQIGRGLHGYSDLQADHSFPGPEVEGPRAAAGVVAPLLVSHKLVEPRVFLCPATSVMRQAGEFVIPLPEELDAAVGQKLKALQQTMGGDYGYNFGYVDGGKLLRTCNLQRSDFALVGDAPSNSRPRRASGNHRGRGQNILFEDGHVKFLPLLPSSQLVDDPYHNRDGWVAPGVDRDDAVLGASADPPLPAPLIEESAR
jgi:hypothetical protein